MIYCLKYQRNIEMDTINSTRDEIMCIFVDFIANNIDDIHSHSAELKADRDTFSNNYEPMKKLKRKIKKEFEKINTMNDMLEAIKKIDRKLE